MKTIIIIIINNNNNNSHSSSRRRRRRRPRIPKKSISNKQLTRHQLFGMKTKRAHSRSCLTSASFFFLAAKIIQVIARLCAHDSILIVQVKTKWWLADLLSSSFLLFLFLLFSSLLIYAYFSYIASRTACSWFCQMYI